MRRVSPLPAHNGLEEVNKHGNGEDQGEYNTGCSMRVVAIRRCFGVGVVCGSIAREYGRHPQQAKASRMAISSDKDKSAIKRSVREQIITF